MANSTTVRSGPGTASLLGVLFVGLKLGGVIDWSWWWVTLPFWGGFAFFFALFLLGVLTYVIGGAALDTRRTRKRRKARARQRTGRLGG